MSVLQRALSGDTNHQVVRLQAAHKALAEKFATFREHLENCKTDPQYFRQMLLKVDRTAVGRRLLTLTLMNGDELRLCFDVVPDASGVKGRVVSYLVKGHQLAQKDGETRPEEIARWHFKGTGETDLKLNDVDNYDMSAQREAVAIAVGLMLAATVNA